MKVLVDTNVLLDFLLEREPFKKDAEELFAATQIKKYFMTVQLYSSTLVLLKSVVS